jgi:single-strand DNA-binding protein
MVNRVIITGYLGAEPEVNTLPSGDLAANVRIASTDRYRDKSSGTIKETTEWHRTVFYGRLASVAHEYLKKGSRVYVEGKLRTRRWTASDGQDKFMTEIVVEHMEMLGGPRAQGNDDTTNADASAHGDDEWMRDYDRAAASLGDASNPTQLAV